MRKLVTAGGLVLVLLVLGAAVAEAATLDGGCEGSATSFDEDGDPLSQVAGPGTGGTKSDPFIVDTDGSIAYEGTSPAAFHDHTWHVDVMGVEVKGGGSKNAGDETATDGVVDVDDYVPLSMVGLFKATGGISADEGSCDGSMWVKVAGSPVGSVAWIGGVVATVLGGAGLVSTVLSLLKKVV